MEAGDDTILKQVKLEGIEASIKSVNASLSRAEIIHEWFGVDVTSVEQARLKLKDAVLSVNRMALVALLQRPHIGHAAKGAPLRTQLLQVWIPWLPTR